jgi:hypothetical protein
LDGHTINDLPNQSAFQNNSIPTFQFTDVTSGKIFVDGHPVTAIGEETPIVDGMIGYVYNDTSVAVVEEATHWTTGGPNTITTADLPDPSLGFTLVTVRYPADFEIRFSDQIVDTSTGGLFFGAPMAKPTNFTVWNLTEDAKGQFLFYDPDSNGLFSVGDIVIVVYGDSLGNPAKSGSYRTTWAVQMYLDSLAGDLRLPASGDVFTIVTTKPFRSGEAFQFKMKGTGLSVEQAERISTRSLLSAHTLVQRHGNPRISFSRVEVNGVYFIHLPQSVQSGIHRAWLPRANACPRCR